MSKYELCWGGKYIKKKMNKDKFKKAKAEIEATIKKSPIVSDFTHANKTLQWLLVLKPDADEALQLAALAHDIERGVTGITDSNLKDMNSYDKRRGEHSERSADFSAEILKKHGFDEEFINRVVDFIKKHEIGGDEESNVLKDADSIAYFDYNIPGYLKRNGLEKARFKIKYMFERVSSPKAKEIIVNLNSKDPKTKRLVEEMLGTK